MNRHSVLTRPLFVSLRVSHLLQTWLTIVVGGNVSFWELLSALAKRVIKRLPQSHAGLPLSVFKSEKVVKTKLHFSFNSESLSLNAAWTKYSRPNSLQWNMFIIHFGDAIALFSFKEPLKVCSDYSFSVHNTCSGSLGNWGKIMKLGNYLETISGLA